MNSHQLIELVKETLEHNGQSVEAEIAQMEHIQNIHKRKYENRTFSFNEHIRGLVLSLLTSNNKNWRNIERNKVKITELFFNFKKENILATNPNYFTAGLFKLKCGSISTNRQMEVLHYNIKMLERIDEENGGLDVYVTSKSPCSVAKEISIGKYKLKQVGYPLAFEYLRNVGIDEVKPDRHIMRVLSEDRLGYLQLNSTEDEAIKVLSTISDEVGVSKAYLDALLWIFCADNYGEICTKVPKCNSCKLNEHCRVAKAV
ncbi:hypothetical protein [Haloplasma contractile]|uniref:N-glycosylase-DNA lyase protein n=1 Tax=Haloplasma contractile SSD-17B TaxID=1033810 RepID=F7Q1S1_9MOLU|nr:hypothetical protein [Haloplasma contractile]ERJ12266.1 putative N-glycosylase-DNA lyase protein [Haloplasma contractile SSD-17B]